MCSMGWGDLDGRGGVGGFAVLIEGNFLGGARMSSACGVCGIGGLRQGIFVH